MAEGRLGTEKSWERLFEELDILDNVEEHGSFRIGAEKIHAYREPRLMTKFDESNDLPANFKENGLAILPVSRTEWTIGPYRAYKEFDRGKEPPVSYFEPPANCLLLHEENIRTEDQRLSQLFASGVFSRFLGEEVRYVNPGRFGSGGFSYLIGDTREKDVLHEVRVQGAQMEIDAALEGPSSITLVEAKNFFPRDFLVRQLYYPFLSYRSGGTLGGKRIRALYITYLSGVYQLWEYEFTDPEAAIPIRQSDRMYESSDSYDGRWPEGLYAVYNDGQLVTDFIYEDCGSESSGLLAVKLDGKWGYVRADGTEVIPAEYDDSWVYDTEDGTVSSCYAASEGYIVLVKDSVWEMRDTDGNLVMPGGVFEEMRPVYDGRCWVKKNGKWGVIEIMEKKQTDRTGEEKDSQTQNEDTEIQKEELLSEIVRSWSNGQSEWAFSYMTTFYDDGTVTEIVEHLKSLVKIQY